MHRTQAPTSSPMLLSYYIQQLNLFPRAPHQSLVLVCSVELLLSSVTFRHHRLCLVMVLEVSNPPITTSSSSSVLLFVFSAAASSNQPPPSSSHARHLASISITLLPFCSDCIEVRTRV
ncbi:hypothetical protein HN51_014238 [Arachis hypogaea]